MIIHEKHISAPYKSPLYRNNEYHISVGNQGIDLDSIYNDNKVENAEFLRWLGYESFWLIIGIILSSISAIARHYKELSLNEVAEKSSWDKTESILKAFPCFAEDAGLSIILALLAIVAGLSVGIAVEDLSKNHMFRFRSMGRTLIRFSNLSVCFLGLSSASLILRYGKGLGVLLIFGLLFCFTMLYGIGDISVNYRTRLKELSNRLHEAEKELCNVANRKRKRYVFRSVGRWNRTLNSIGLSFVILVYVCSSVHQHKLLLANLVISFTLVVFYWLSVYVLGSILYDSIKVFEGLTKEIRPLKILYRIALSVFSFTASMYLSMIFILTSHQCLFYVSCVLLFILLLYICYFSLSSKNRRFLFIETRTAKLKKNVSLTRRLIGLMQSEEQLV